MKATFKVKRTEGVGVKPDCDWIKYIGKSRIDNYPIFQIDYEKMPYILPDIAGHLIVNTKPGYRLHSYEFEEVKSLEHYVPTTGTIASELVDVQAMSAPTGLTLCMEFQYSESDERLLLI